MDEPEAQESPPMPEARPNKGGRPRLPRDPITGKIIGAKYKRKKRKKQMTEKVEKAAENEAPKGKMAKVKVIRGYWPTADAKVLPGTVIDVPIDQAKDLVAKKIAELQFED